VENVEQSPMGFMAASFDVRQSKTIQAQPQTRAGPFQETAIKRQYGLVT
jgi:hypothetical protein